MSRFLRPALLLMLVLAGCATHLAPPGPPIEPARETADAFVMPDGMRLPYRAWLPEGAPWAVMLALHGMNDSRDAWEIPAPDFAAAGIAVFSPDQRGFGDTRRRAATGRARPRWWTTPGAWRRCCGARYPHARLILMGESMGAAALMCLATAPDRAGRRHLCAGVTGGLEPVGDEPVRARWAVADRRGCCPGSPSPANQHTSWPATTSAALIRLSRDPLTIHDTRFDTIDGLVNLMDAAAAAAPRFNAPSLFLYGGKDELIPPGCHGAGLAGPAAGAGAGVLPRGYHLLLRDLERAGPIGDVINWLLVPAAPLPSGAEAAAAAWLASSSRISPKCSGAPRLAFAFGRFAVWGWRRTRSSAG